VHVPRPRRPGHRPEGCALSEQGRPRDRAGDRGARRRRAAGPARVAHTVEPGETLWSIAAANNFTTRALAAPTTAERVTPSQVEDLALQQGVDPGLAAAVARQESGFNNGLVSSANARGVMQILPRTWDFVERRLAGRRLNPASVLENVHAGVMYPVACSARPASTSGRPPLPIARAGLGAADRNAPRHPPIRGRRHGPEGPVRPLGWTNPEFPQQRRDR
jgi:hypothetical protein